MKRLTTIVTIGLLFALVLAGCGRGPVDAGPVQTDDDTDAAVDEEPTPDDTDPSDDTDPDPQGDPDDQDTDPVPDTTNGSTADDDPDSSTPSETTAVRLYFLAPGGDTPARSGPFLVSVQRDIPSTPRIALATLRELVDGPSSRDRALIDGISTAVPDHTLVLDVGITDGIATVDLSREFESGGGSTSMFARLAQVVYTVTQFPTVDAVEFELDGSPVTVFSGEGIVLDEPVSRTDYQDLLPTVFVDTPAAGATVRGNVRITGSAAVFEATFQYRLETADGHTLDEGFAMTDNGMGWGAIDVTLDVDVRERTDATLVVWEYSAKDGSIQAYRESPLTLLP